MIIGPGINGRGETGRVAYVLIKLGFKNIYISSKNKLLSAGFQTQPTYSPVATKSKAFKISLQPDLSIEKDEILALLKQKKFLLCIDVRPDKVQPEAVIGTQTCKKISWRSFFNEDLQIKAEAKNLIASFSKTDRIVLMGEAGLASAGAMLALRELGFEKAVLFEGGYSGLRALSDSLLNTK